LKLRQMVRKRPLQDQANISRGLFFSSCLIGVGAYACYRKYIQEEFLVSHAHYKMSEKMVNATPWKKMYFTWYRMPYQEYNAYHRFRPYYVLG
jgi:hypothetical protein